MLDKQNSGKQSDAKFTNENDLLTQCYLNYLEANSYIETSN